MASWSATGSINSNFKLELNVWENWTSLDNYSNVHWEVILRSTGNYSFSLIGSTIVVNVDGEVYNAYSQKDLSAGGSILIASGDKNIWHNADGYKTIYCSASYTQTSTAYYTPGNMSCGGNMDLSRIARASTPSCITWPNTTQNIGDLGNTITIHMNRASQNFTHTVYYSWGSISNKIIASGVTDNTTWTIPKELANHIPNSTSGTGTIICETYNNGAYIGTKTVSFTATVPNTDEFKPKISSISIVENADSGVPQEWGFYVQNKSQIDFDIAASGTYSSTINSLKTVLNGVTYTTTSGTTEPLILSGTNTIVVTLTDSRGRTVTKTEEFEVVAYDGITINKFTVDRCNEDGTLSDEGEFVYVDVETTIPKLNNQNTYSYSLQYKIADNKFYETHEFELTETQDDLNYIISGNVIFEADGDNSFDYLLNVVDCFVDISKVEEIEPVFQLLNFKSNGKGWAAGKVAEKDAFEINMDIYDKFNTLINNGVADYESPGITDPDTTLSYLCLTKTNTPISDEYFYIMTIFYKTKSETANRTQLAIPYIYDINQNIKNVYIRQCVNGEWNEWYSQTEGKVLYYDTNGTTEIVTLTETTANFNSIEVFAKYGSTYYTSVKIPEPNGKGFNLTTAMMNQTVSLGHIASTNYIISNSTITPQYYGEWHTSDNSFTAENKITILKVIGYK